MNGFLHTRFSDKEFGSYTISARASIPLSVTEQNTIYSPLPELSSDLAFSYSVLAYAYAESTGLSVLGSQGFEQANQ